MFVLLPKNYIHLLCQLNFQHIFTENYLIFSSIIQTTILIMEEFQADLRSSQFSTSKGISWITASLFLIADMAGGGVVALPIAMLNTGLIVGTLSLLLIGSAFCYTAHLLGECWLTMCRRWPESYGSTHCRKPYPEIAYRAMGEGARLFMSCTLNVLLFAVATVYLLLGSTIINELWASLFPAYAIGKCLMILIMAVAIYPVTLLKSPKNFWWAVVTAMLTTSISVVLILVGSAVDSPECANAARQPPFRPVNYFLSSGVFFFAFGGHGVFPTIQHDMRQPKQFTRSSIVAFLVVGTMYLPLSYLGYFVYGDSLQDSIISSIQTNFIQQFANLFIGIHCILTMTLIFNPLNQEVEHLLNISHHFCWQRVLIRTVMMAAIVFVALTVPNFGPILDLIGGTGVALTAAILPCTFFLFMHAADEIPSIQCWKTMNMENVDNLASKFDGPIIFEIPNLKKVFERTPTLILAINFSVIVIAIICGIAATYVAIGELSDSKFDGPCYLRLASDKFVVKTAAMHCCGAGRNISRHPEFDCPIFQ